MQSFKRLFIGTFLKTDALISEYPKIKREFEVAVTGKWVEEWNLHFTYHFLGNVPVEAIPEILKELEPILKEYSYELTLQGLGCFPSLNSPRVLYVNIKESEKLLKQIHTSCSEVLTKLNFEIEQREYKP
ncbi:MAG: RNA 2',3'-cyclic phosphodiesterase, partial [Candidatus Kapaibacteriota bacterium]